MIDDKFPLLRTNPVLPNTRITSENQIPVKVGVGLGSAFSSLQSSRCRAQRVNTAAKDLSTTINHNKVSHIMIFLINVCCMNSLNQVELIGSGHFIQDDSRLSMYKGANERKCVTTPNTITTKFVSTLTPVLSCQEQRDVSRQSFSKADSSEVGIQDFIIAQWASSIDGFCHKRRLYNRIPIQTFGLISCSTFVWSEEVLVIPNSVSASSDISPLWVTFTMSSRFQASMSTLARQFSTSKVADPTVDSLVGTEIIVISADVPRKTGMTRDGLFNTNASIVVDIYIAVLKVCPKAIISNCIALTFTKDERDEPNPRTDTTISADVDTISRAKKHEVR